MSYLKEILLDFFNGLNLISELSNIIVSLLIVILWFFIGIISIKVLKILLFRVFKIKQRGARALTVGKLTSSVVKYIIWFVVMILILEELNVDVTPIIASAGVFGLAIGFGAQEVVRDFVSGFFIIFEESFNVGDVVQIGGFTGTVMELGLRITKIKNWRDEILIIRNGDMGNVINYSLAGSVAVVDFGVSYNTDLIKFKELINSFIDSIDGKFNVIIEKPKYLGIIELADSSINMRIIAKTIALEHFQIERDIRNELVVFCNENNIEIPFPQLVIHNE